MESVSGHDNLCCRLIHISRANAEGQNVLMGEILQQSLPSIFAQYPQQYLWVDAMKIGEDALPLALFTVLPSEQLPFPLTRSARFNYGCVFIPLFMNKCTGNRMPWTTVVKTAMH